MKLLIQRVLNASVTTDGQTVGAIGPGVLVFLGVTHTDTADHARRLADKLVHLRLFEDDRGLLNRSLLDTHGSALIISQFTLYADCNTGRRPSFTDAAPPALANRLYLQFIDDVRNTGTTVATGLFGATMQVSLTNDGPVTLILEK